MRNIAIDHAALGCPCTTQALEANPPGAGPVTRRTTAQVSWREAAEPKVPQQPQHHQVRQGQLGICFPSLHQLPIDVTAGWAAPQLTPGPHLNSWVECSNVSKVSCPRKQHHLKVVQLGIKLGTFRLPGRCPNHLAIHTQHTHIHCITAQQSKHRTACTTQATKQSVQISK